MRDFSGAHRIVVKVGTSSLTYDTGRINIRCMDRLIEVLSDLANSGRQIVLVTSGAVGVGVGKLGLPGRPGDTITRQAAAAVGQCELMYLYDRGFSRYHHNIAQVLLTRDVVEKITLRGNVINTFAKLFELGVIPVVNENDTVATEEIEGENFGDNDTLSAIVADLVEADLLILLSDIDGLYTKSPHENPDASLIPVVERIDNNIEVIASGSYSSHGTGGMATKIQAGKIASKAGIDMVIMNGADPGMLYDLLEGKQIGTLFMANT